MTWPVMLIGETSTQIWSQTSNPTNETIAGYEALRVQCTAAHWGGLQRSDSGASRTPVVEHLSFLDGSINSSDTYYAVKVTRPVQGGIPACQDTLARMTELYVWHGEFHSISRAASRPARWVLVFRQTVLFPWNNTYSDTDATAPNYDILDQLERYRTRGFSRKGAVSGVTKMPLEPERRFVFILNYPEMLIGSRKMQMWSQESNPTQGRIELQNVANLALDCTGNHWGGLGLAEPDYASSPNKVSGYHLPAQIHGSVAVADTWYAIRQNRPYYGGLRACDGENLATVVELYAWEASPATFASSLRECHREGTEP
jgi:hypothetical protein